MKLHEIVIIDDNDADLLFAELTLQDAGVTESVRTFETAIEALRHLEEPREGAGIVLVDINMPEMSGFEFLERYCGKRAARRGFAPVVMLTSSSDPVDIARARAFPCVKLFLTKPLDRSAALALAQLAVGSGSRSRAPS
jgi:CheY-like chemotaxis protein